MSNKRALQNATKELTKAKAPSKSRDIIYDPKGQWAHPGQNTRIPGGNITMQGVPYPVYAQPNVGQPQMMYPGQDYIFPGADYVDEYPQMKKGGYTRGLVPMPKPSKKGLASKAYSRSLEATNRLFTENELFKKPKDKRRKVFDPNAKYYQDGGVSPIEGDLISKVLMNRNRGVDFVDRAYALGDNPGTPLFNVPDDEEFGNRMSHKMSWGTDDQGQTWMFPTVLNPNDEAIKVPNQYADYISSEGYKNATGMNYQDGGEYGMPLGTGVSQNFIGNRDQFKVGGIPELPLRDNQVNYNAYVNRFEPKMKYPDGGGKSSSIHVTPNIYTSKVDPDTQVIGGGLDISHKSGLHANVSADLPFRNKNILPSSTQNIGFGKRYKNLYGDFSISNYSEPKKPFNPSASLELGLEKHLGKNIDANVGFQNTMTPGSYFNPRLNAGIKYSFEDGGESYIETELTDDEIQAYKDGGYIVEDISIPSLNQFPDGGVYTFEERADSKYKKDSKGNWLISNPSTKGKYVPIKDPSGSRTKTLNRWAENQDFNQAYRQKVADYDKNVAESRANEIKKFEAGIDYSALPSETINQVAGNYLGNFGQKSKNLFTETGNKKQVLKNIPKEEKKNKALRETRDKVTNLVLMSNNLSPEQKQVILDDPKALAQINDEYTKYQRDLMGAAPGYDFTSFKVLPNKKETVNLSDITPNLPNLGYNLPSVLNQNKKITIGPNKLTTHDPITKRKEMASGRAGVLDSYYVAALLGGLALPEAVAAVDAASSFAPFKALPTLNIGNALTAKGVYDAGTKYIPNSIEAYQRGQREGWTTKNAADFGYNTLKSGLSLVPLSQTLKNINAVNKFKTAFTAGDSGIKLSQNPTDPVAHYKTISALGSLSGLKKEGGESKYVDTELTDAEIQDLIDDGYIVELL